MCYLHAVDSSTIACNGGDVIVGLSCNWETSHGFETSEWGNHVGMVNSGNSRGGNHRGGHFPFSFSVLCYLIFQALLKLAIYNGEICVF